MVKISCASLPSDLYCCSLYIVLILFLFLLFSNFSFYFWYFYWHLAIFSQWVLPIIQH